MPRTLLGCAYYPALLGTVFSPAFLKTVHDDMEIEAYLSPLTVHLIEKLTLARSIIQPT